MSENETPVATFDVIVHDVWQYVYRVAFFGDIPDEWLAEWEVFFKSISTLEEHAANIVDILHAITRIGPGPALLEGYGKITWLKHNWRRLAVWTSKGEEIAFAAIKLLDAKRPTKKYDYTTVGPVEWEGFDVIYK